MLIPKVASSSHAPLFSLWPAAADRRATLFRYRLSNGDATMTQHLDPYCQSEGWHQGQSGGITYISAQFLHLIWGILMPQSDPNEPG